MSTSHIKVPAQGQKIIPGQPVPDNPIIPFIEGDGIGIDITEHASQVVFDLWKGGGAYAYVITVCHESEAGGCPVFQGPTRRLHWPFQDPSKFTGTEEEKLAQTRAVRDEIAAKIGEWCEQECPAAPVA